MKNRTEEYWTLVGELAQPPQALEGSVERAKKRAKRAGLLRRLTAPAASLATAAAAFVLLVNVFPTFALACSGVPVIRELAAAAAFSPSLSAAVAHDYVQYIGQSQTVDGVTMNLGYAIVDRHQAVFFYSVDHDARFLISPNVIAPDGRGIRSYATSTSYVNRTEENGLRSTVLSFTAGTSLPDRFTLEMFLTAIPEQDQTAKPAPPADSLVGEEPDDIDPRENPDTLRFTFDVTLDPSRICEPTTVEVDRWLELDGQRILVNRLELFPTRTILYLGEDGENAAWLRSLKFHFEDERGNCYNDIDGTMSASGSISGDTYSYLTYYFQSFYYAQPERLTLCIDAAEWLDKDASHVVLDLTTGECAGLPNGLAIESVSRTEQNATITVAPPIAHQVFGRTFGQTYWDPEGGAHTWNGWTVHILSGDDGRDAILAETFHLEDYPWDTVELAPDYTGVSQYEEPIRVALFP